MAEEQPPRKAPTTREFTVIAIVLVTVSVLLGVLVVGFHLPIALGVGMVLGLTAIALFLVFRGRRR